MFCEALLIRAYTLLLKYLLLVVKGEKILGAENDLKKFSRESSFVLHRCWEGEAEAARLPFIDKMMMVVMTSVGSKKSRGRGT